MENNEINSQETILSVKDLKVSFRTDDGLVHAVRGVSFDLYKGETLCIVGESGSGKSVTSKTIMGILPANAVIEDGQVMFENEDLTKVQENEFHRIRGHKIGMIFQDPLSSLNPIMKVGKQITEAMMINANQLKVRYKKLISNTESQYKGLRNRRCNEIKGCRQAVKDSDAKFDREIEELKRQRKVLEKDLIDLRKNDDPTLPRKENEYKIFMSSYESNIQGILDKKKIEHEHLAGMVELITDNAKANYKRDYPIYKEAYKEAKKAAKNDNRRFVKDRKHEHEVLITQLNDEKAAISAKYDKAIENARYTANSNPGDDDAQERYATLVRERDEAVRKNAAAIEKENIDFSCAFRISRKEAKRRAISVMREVGIPQPEVRFKQYPFEFSGGMRQRIVIAIALTANPEILICDEPTTALDVTIQAQILELINRLKAQRNMSIIFISHDLGVVANMADRVAVMYAGKIVEVGTANDIFYDPRHPYTWALLSSIPDIDSKEKLEAIPGTPPYLLHPPVGDAFAARNKYALAIDFRKEPPYFRVSDTHYAATWLLDGRAPAVEMPRIVSQRIKLNLKKAGYNNVQELEGK